MAGLRLACRNPRAQQFHPLNLAANVPSRTRRREMATGRECDCGPQPPAGSSQHGFRPCRSFWRKSRPGSACGVNGKSPASSLAIASTISSAPLAISRSCNSPAVISGIDGDTFGQRHRPGIEPRIHLHHHHAGLRVTCHDRPLDRRSAAPARQQRGMTIVRAKPRAIQNGLRQQKAVGDHNSNIGVQRLERLNIIRRL